MIGWIALVTLAFAQDEEAPADTTHSGSRLPALPREPTAAELHTPLPELTRLGDAKALPYPLEAYRAAEALHVEPEFAHGVQSGLDLVYRRDYSGARDHFAALEARFPDTVSRSLGDVVVWQALMLENFDFRYDKQYWTASKQARADLAKAEAAPGNEAWESLVRATVYGIESIHTMRQESYLPALQLAFQAMNAIEACRAAAPEFVDLKLADGIYNYWRTVVTMESKMLPDFGDHRVEGIEQMQLVEQRGLFIAPLAALALSYTWLEEGNSEKALAATVQNRAHYPDNVINNLMAGTILHQMRKYDKAIEAYDRILAADPKNDRVHYWRGVTFLKTNRVVEATAELERYLEGQFLEKWQRSYGLYRLGQVYARQEQYGEAIAKYEAAIALDGNKSAKTARDRLQERKRQGQIDW
jgi:tetratricopeptide (TPR) repeat protein